VLTEVKGLLAAMATDPALLDAVCSRIVEVGEYAAAFLAVATEEGDALHRVACAGSPPAGGAALDEAAVAALKSGEPVVATADEAPGRTAPTVAVFPLMAGGRAFGVLAVCAAGEEAFAAREVGLLRELADAVAYAAVVSNARAEYRRTEAMLAESEHRYRLLFEHAPQPMWLYDIETLAFLEVNQMAVQHYGWSRDEFLAMTIRDIRPPEDVAALLASVQRRTSDPHTGQWRHRRNDGSIIDVEVRSHAVPRLGRTVRLVVVTDITERRRAEDERRLLTAAAEAAADGIVVTDREGRIQWANRAFSRMTGFAHDEVVGQTPRMLKSGRQDESFYRRLWRTILGGRVWHGELVNRRRDGTFYDEEQTITPVRGADGVVTHFVCIKHDITGRTRAAEALRRSEEKYRALIENALDLIAVIGQDWTFRYASPSFERLLGHRPDVLLGLNAFQVVHQDDRSRLVAMVSELQKSPGATASAEFRVKHADGRIMVVEAGARSLLDDPAVRGIIINARDVTERKRSEEAQIRLQGQLAHSEKLAAMGELLAGVAHELNNPLSIVMGHTELLRRAPDADDRAARAEKIEQAAYRCARIVKNFLALARQHPTERQRVSLDATVRDTVELLAYALRVDDVQVSLALEPNLPVLWADGHQLQQVVLNLLTNAHHAMRQVRGPRKLTVTARLLAEAAMVQLEVSDTGPGIPPDVERRIFDPFFTTKPVGQGTGLGLSICKGLVEAHGGRMEVEGRPGQGALFRVQLPIGVAVTRTDAPAPAPAGLPHVLSVLVVDDESGVASVLAEMCAGEGHQVDTAGDGVDALALIERKDYDVIITDVKMPRLDGPGLYQAVEGRRPDLLPRFAFITGDLLNPATARFFEEQRVLYLRKPFNLDDVQALLRKVTAAR
jgi:nitrogen fixation negative regulator NifL